MKDDERFLLSYLNFWTRIGCPVRQAIEAQCRVPPKRCWYLLGKWARKGWYDYGVTVDLGWFTVAGKEAALSMPGPAPQEGSP